MRVAPARTVTRPPATAAIRIATPSGSDQCQPKNANDADSVFWAMNTSRIVRTSSPAMSEDHSAAARVNLTSLTAAGVLVAGGAGAGGAGGIGGVASWAEPSGSLVVIPSLFPS